MGYILYTVTQLKVHISKVAIDRKHRRQGIAKQLVQVIELPFLNSEDSHYSKKCTKDILAVMCANADWDLILNLNVIRSDQCTKQFSGFMVT